MAQKQDKNIKPVKNVDLPVERNVEELEEEIQKHRKKTLHMTLTVISILLLLLLGTGLYFAFRSFESFEVISEVDLVTSAATKYTSFGDNIITYSNDGISARNQSMELLWNQAYEMGNPKVYTCEDYLLVYDKDGTSLYIISIDGLMYRIDTISPIEKACVASQGTVAVLMKDGVDSYVRVYDKEGNDLVSGSFYGSKGSFPVDIAFSYDAKKLAVTSIDLSDGKIKSTISFYNFGSVGQNEIDNNVGTFTYDDVIIARTLYVSSTRMVAASDQAIYIFDGSQKPKLSKQIDFEHEMTSVMFDDKYIGLMYANDTDEMSYHLCFYNYTGSLASELDTDMAYESAEFLDHHEICLINSKQCEIYTTYGVKKFQYTFEDEIRKIFSVGSGREYIFVESQGAREVRLK